ncbi:MAG: hypothetical protein AABY13_04795, partial [Nanoarchaeota archaeon]
ALSKKAVTDFAHALQLTYPSWSVRCVFPGPTDTQMARYGFCGKALKQRLRIMLTPQDLADRIVRFMHSDKHALVYDRKRNVYATR